MKQLTILIFVMLFWHVSSVYADEIDLSLSPSTIEIIASPGDSVRTPVTLTNNGALTQSLSIRFKTFDKLREDGFPDLTSQEATTSSFVTLLKDEETLGDFIDVRPDETVQLLLVGQIPKDAESSDHYTTLLFQTRNRKEVSADQTASYIEGGLGTNILLSIKERQQDQLFVKIAEFQTNRFIFTDEPISFNLAVQNEGKHFVGTTGRIDLTDVADNPVNTVALPQATILAGSMRNLTQEISTISPHGLFGKYKAKTTITAYDQVLTQTVALYVIPKNILITTIGILFVAVFLVSRIRFYLLKNRRLSPQKRKKRR